MASTPPATRRLLHRRDISFEGYLRDDGMLDIEGRLQDLTAVPTPMPFGALEAGAAIHDMRLVVTVDAEMRIHSVRAVTDTGATPYCAEINAAYAGLAGLCIGPGFKHQVKERVGGVKGCTHLTELMNGLANAAMQTWFSLRREASARQRKTEASAPLPKPFVVGTCHAYRLEGEATQIIWPPGRRAVAQPLP